MAPRHQIVQPQGWSRPKGYANGVVGEGRVLFVGGQVGWDPRSDPPRFPPTFAEQFDQALANVVAVVREAGGQPEDLARCTVYVCDRREYLDAIKEVGTSWRRHVGKHFPAMALLVVAGLLEVDAKVEIEATAVL